VTHDIVLFADQLAGGAEVLASRREDWVSKVRRYVESATKDVNTHNTTLRQAVTREVEQRRGHLHERGEFLRNLGVPLAARDGSSSVPLVVESKRVPDVVSHSPTLPGGSPHWEMQDADYEEALRLVTHLIRSAERMPGTFERMGEESIRDVMLVMLNGHFEGQAGAELFNGKGKTDILLRKDDDNVFIAELKVWNGPAALTRAIDQLLGYVTWRDTKAVLIPVIRVRDPDRAVASAHQAVADHGGFVCPVGDQSQPEVRADYLLRHPSDPDRSVRVALVPFVLPQAS